MALTTTLTIAGNLTGDPELAYDRNGKPYARVSVAVNPRAYDRDAKEWKDGEPVYWKGTVFGDLAEHVAHSLSKGHRVIVHGTVKADNWVDKDSGTKRTEKSLQIEDIGPSLMFMNATPTKSAPSQSADSHRPQDESGIGGQNGWATPGDDTPF